MATNTPAGWYADPMGRNEHRYWDGARWTEHVGTRGTQSRDPLDDPVLPQDTTAEEQDPVVPAQPGLPATADTSSTQSPAAGPTSARPASEVTAAPQKVNAFNAKRVATELQTENAKLRADIGRLEVLLAEMGAVGVTERQERIRDSEQIERDLQARVVQLRREVDELDRAVIVSRDRLVLEEMGLFDFEHPAESSATLSTDLEALRSQIRQLNKLGAAITATANFTYNNSAAKGRTFVNQMSRIMLRAYNAEAENAVKSVKAGNLASAQKRLSSAREQIAKQGTMIELSVTPEYHRMRLDELELAARHLQAVAAEKELDRERRAELREQKVLEAEIRREKERLEKERAHYVNSIHRLRAAGDNAAADALQADLDRVDDEIVQADYRVANIRAGYVYVISNLGAFGEGVVKIGMTRRLEPMDRIRELGDASVPFTFDVHALFFSDDAVTIEAMLHREFAAQRLNKVNPRKEFFRVDPQTVLNALTDHHVSVLEFNTHAAAEDFRMSWPAAPAG